MKKEWITSFTWDALAWMDLDNLLGESSQTQETTYRMTVFMGNV